MSFVTYTPELNSGLLGKSPTFTPSGEQQKFLESFTVFAAAPVSKVPEENMFMLLGKAGTGKTSILKVLEKSIFNRLRFTAMTHKAAVSLRKAVGCDVSTTASALKLLLKTNIYGEKVLVQNAEIDITKDSILVIDEISQISPLYMEHIFNVAKTAKVLFIGDAKQAPYVNLDDTSTTTLSPVFNLNIPPTRKISLEQVMRFGGDISVITDLARNTIYRGRFPVNIPAALKASENVVETSVDYFMDNIVLSEFAIGESTVVCWRNATVEFFNKFIRGKLFPEVTDSLVVGDRLIVTSPLRSFTKLPEDGGVFEGDVTEVVPIASTDTIVSVQKICHNAGKLFGITYSIVTAIDEFGNLVRLPVPATPQQRHLWENALIRLKEKLLAAPMNKKKDIAADLDIFSQLFLSYRYAYALTAHRIQGTTVKSTYVLVDDFLRNRRGAEGRMLLHVAYTRPTTRLTLVKGLPKL